MYIKGLIPFFAFILCISSWGKGFSQDISLFCIEELASLTSYYLPIYKSDSCEVEELMDFNLLNVFVFNGDCSLCLGEMSDVDKFFTRHKKVGLKTLFIVETADTIQFNFYRDKFDIQATVLLDYDYRMRGNGNLLGNSQIFLINNRGEILLKGDILNNKKINRKYLQIIDKNRK